MSNIKVGAYVKVVSASEYDKTFFRVGAGGRVVQVGERCVLVHFTHGDFTMAGRNEWAVFPHQLEVVTPYSSTFANPAEPKPTTGHVANGGGLQKHSVGAFYPLAVVGYADGTHLRFTVENLETGGVAACGAVVRAWDTAKGAVSFAERVAKGVHPELDAITWNVERPTFDGKMLVFDSAQRFVLA